MIRAESSGFWILVLYVYWMDMLIIDVFQLRPVTNYNEITTHFLECIHAHCSNTRFQVLHLQILLMQTFASTLISLYLSLNSKVLTLILYARNEQNGSTPAPTNPATSNFFGNNAATPSQTPAVTSSQVSSQHEFFFVHPWIT